MNILKENVDTLTNFEDLKDKTIKDIVNNMKYLECESEERLENAELMFENECDFRIDTSDRVYVVTEVLGHHGNSQEVGVYRTVQKAINKVDEVEYDTGNPAYFMEYVLVEYKDELLSSLANHERADLLSGINKNLDELSNEEVKEISHLVFQKWLDKRMNKLKEEADGKS